MYGRGGAGNINAAKESAKKAAEDLEAQRSPTTSTPAARPGPANAAQEYAHMGRGGAGNWYQPTELQKDGTFSAPADATAQPASATPQVSTPWHPEGQEMPVARSGRGGAGNFVWKSAEEERRGREEEERRQELVREQVERVVDRGLARPEGVALGKGGERWADEREERWVAGL